MRASKGSRSGTRHKLSLRASHKFTITPYLKVFEPNEKVVIKIDPYSQKGMPHHKYKGMVGTVMFRRGRSFMVKIQTGGTVKQIIARPEHLRSITESKGGK